MRARRTESRHAALTPLEPEEGEREQADWLGVSCEDEVIDRLALTDALGRLSPKHRETLELVFVFGFSPDEVARILDVPGGTVKSRISYARRALLLALRETAPVKEARS